MNAVRFSVLDQFDEICYITTVASVAQSVERRIRNA